MAGEVSPRSTRSASRRPGDAIGGAELAIGTITLLALAIGSWAVELLIESLDSASARAIRGTRPPGEVSESEE